MLYRRGHNAPPFCPNPSCSFHVHPAGWIYKRIGFFYRISKPYRIQRFLCLQCRRSFSTQTFSTTYWLKRPNLLATLLRKTLVCSSLRQIAWEIGVAPSTVQRQVERLGRHCLLFQHLHRPPPREPVVLDGFESFEFSQYHPFHFNLVVGAKSHFLYAFTDSELRRKGSMRPDQRARRAWLERVFGRPDPKAVEREVAEAIQLAAPEGSRLRIESDEHRAYPRAFRRLPRHEITHTTTPSGKPRTSRNPLFPVNLLDLLIRHTGANHKRETIAFSKRRQGAADRLAILQVWRNFMKPFSEKKRDASPAERRGMMVGKLTPERLLEKRLFPSKVKLPERLMRYYRREIVTRRIPNGRRHRLSYAF